ncbi:hypothetical protein S40293_09649 [Stachybotrys chartarum IBT 40293]|nr:hypothetical protein S40293_09649 [Stachybotrys chartarum IBT 40293]
MRTPGIRLHKLALFGWSYNNDFNR